MFLSLPRLFVSVRKLSFIVYCRPLYLNASHFVVILGHTLCLVFKVVWVWSVLWSPSQPHQLYEPLSLVFPQPCPQWSLSTHCTLCHYLCIMLLQSLCHHVRVLEPILYDSSFSKGGYTLFCLPCTLEAETGRSLSSRAACSAGCVPGRSELHRRSPVLKNQNQRFLSQLRHLTLDLHGTSSSTHRSFFMTPLSNEGEWYTIGHGIRLSEPLVERIQWWSRKVENPIPLGRIVRA